MTRSPTSPSFLQSPLLLGSGFVHGFSTRHGGCSHGPFASLNLGASVGDDEERVEENHRLLAAEAHIPRASFRTVSQVHGDEVQLLDDPHQLGAGIEADAVASLVPGLVPAVRTADCVPILLADPETGWAAAIHAGWRGTESRIAGKAVEAFSVRGSRRQGLIAAIGPAIGRCCYEVSSDLASRFQATFGPEVASGRHLDLALANRLTLLDAGLPADSIESMDRCTSCDSGRFFSHRRDRGITGRHLSFIEARAPQRRRG